MKSILALLLLATATLAQAAEFTADSLVREIATMRTLLDDTSRTVEFFKTCVDPDELRKAAKTDEELAALAKIFDEDQDKRPTLSATLAQVDAARVTLDDEKKTATSPGLTETRPITFHFVDGHWYIKN